MGRRLGAAILAAGLALAGGANAQDAPAPDRGDLLIVLNAALYPVEVMAYCYREVGADPAFQAAGTAWVTRNGDLLAKVQALGEIAGVPDDARLAGDRQALADIQKLVGSQPDGSAYCTLIAGIVNAGQFDLTIRSDLQPALKRIFPTP